MQRRSLLAGLGATAARAMAASGSLPIPLGKLKPFWRASAALGPFLETGIGLVEIPPYWLRGDFAYRRRPFGKEVPFADHLSLVRLLGGYNDGSAKGAPDAAVRERDLAFRGEDGQICYRMHLLRPRLQPYLDNGYTSLTLVLDNAPRCFPEKPGTAGLGQFGPPRNVNEWRAFIGEVCRELLKIMGRDAAQGLRFRVGTENNGRERFNGTHAEYLRHYDATVAAIQEVLPEAKVGPFNISGAGVESIARLHNVNAFALAEHCARDANGFSGKRPVPFDFVAFSRYYRPGEDPEARHVSVCREVWDEFERRVPRMKGVSREIHEFGSAPWGEVEKGVFPSAEPGALGGALLCQMMFRLRAAGIHRLWHWSTFDRYRSRTGELVGLPFSNAWVYSVADHMAGGEAYLLPALEASDSGAQYLAVGSFARGRTLLMISAYHTDLGRRTAETVRFRVPGELQNRMGRMRYTRLSRETAVYDRMRRELAAAELLTPEFASRPDRCGSVREMGRGRAAEFFVASRQNEYEELWRESLTLRPWAESAGLCRAGGTDT